MSSSAVTSTINAINRGVIKGSKHWPHKSPALVVSFVLLIEQSDYLCHCIIDLNNVIFYLFVSSKTECSE